MTGTTTVGTGDTLDAVRHAEMCARRVRHRVDRTELDRDRERRGHQHVPARLLVRGVVNGALEDINTIRTRSGDTSTMPEASMVSVTAFMPTHRPLVRDRAKPCRPRSM